MWLWQVTDIEKLQTSIVQNTTYYVSTPSHTWRLTKRAGNISMLLKACQYNKEALSSNYIDWKKIQIQ